MTQRKALYGSTAVFIAMTGVAEADVTAREVWDNMSSFYAAAGYEIEPGAVTEASGTVTVSGLAINFPNPYADLQDEVEIDIDIEIADIVLTEMGDGTVEVAVPDTYALVVSVAPDGDDEGRFGMTIDQTGMSILASGEPDLVTYTIAAPRVAATLDTIEVPDASITNEEINAVIGIDNVAGTYTVGSGDASTLAMNLTADGTDFTVAAQEPGGGNGRFDMNIAYSGITWASTANIAQGDKPGDMTSMLRAGMTSSTELTHAGGGYSVDFMDDSDSFAMNGLAGSGAASIAMDAEGLSYRLSNTDMTLNVSGSEIPLPEVAIAAAGTAFGVTMPVLASETEQDIGLTVRLEGLSVSDMIWGMIDPAGELPRDPANVILELAGKGNWFLDIMDPTATAEFSGGMPGDVKSMDINELEVSVVGASLTGTGGFTFNMEDFSTFAPFPAATGVVDLQLDGANALIDKLISMGLLPSEQAMGARMMMGLFARPGDGPDSLVSRIELDGESGAISANGQRLR
ncbi:MAG: DUF2125 domain-containing protein [Pseudomonadota bacterium]